MRTFKQLLLYVALTGLFFTSCSKDEDDRINEPTEPAGAYEKGILVSNEGPFGSGTGTISFISENFETVEQEIYKNVNGSAGYSPVLPVIITMIIKISNNSFQKIKYLIL